MTLFFLNFVFQIGHILYPYHWLTQTKARLLRLLFSIIYKELFFLNLGSKFRTLQLLKTCRLDWYLICKIFLNVLTDFSIIYLWNVEKQYIRLLWPHDVKATLRHAALNARLRPTVKFARAHLSHPGRMT
jgi:hypothetical protein